jgi:hypothetical protein
MQLSKWEVDHPTITLEYRMNNGIVFAIVRENI